MTSPVKFVGKIRLGYRARFQTSSCNSDSANWPGYEAESFTHIEQIEHRVGAVGREGLVN